MEDKLDLIESVFKPHSGGVDTKLMNLADRFPNLEVKVKDNGGMFGGMIDALKGMVI